MTFKDREKRRLHCLKSQLFTPEACEPGIYRKKPRDFCLHDDRAKENLHVAIRDEAIRYFKERNIRWSQGVQGGPSNHLCCSQCCCVNFWFPFAQAPSKLALVLRGLGYDAVEMLPFELDRTPTNNICPYITFEWIGERNYLKEHTGGRIARDDERRRGQHFTSLDFAFRFRRSDGRIQIVGGEWKYTECYTNAKGLRSSKKGTDRLAIYQPSLEDRGCQISLGCLSPEALFFDPFDQLMRHQLLCSSMENHHEMGADIVSLLHVAPVANKQLMDRVTAPAFRSIGSSIHEVWSKLVKPGRFSGIYLEALLPLMCQYAPDSEWATYINLRYGGMK